MSEQRPITAEELQISVPPRYEGHHLPPGQAVDDHEMGNKPNYDDLKAEQATKQEYFWSELTFSIKRWAIIAATIIAVLVVVGLAALVVWLVLVLVIHYTAPNLGWLKPEELTRLGIVYGNFAKVAAPIALLTNAWLVAHFGGRRWAGRDR